MATKLTKEQAEKLARKRRRQERAKKILELRQAVHGVQVHGTRGQKAGADFSSKFQPGNSRGGRPKGVVNHSTKLTREMEKQLIERAQQGIPITPLEFFLKTLTDPRTSKKDKQWAAAQAAPYIHRKMPIAIEGGDSRKPVLFATMEQLSRLSDNELQILQSAVSRIGQAASEATGGGAGRDIEGDAVRVDGPPGSDPD